MVRLRTMEVSYHKQFAELETYKSCDHGIFVKLYVIAKNQDPCAVLDSGEVLWDSPLYSVNRIG